MLSNVKPAESPASPILRAKISIHSRVREAVFPARSIAAANCNKVSTARTDAAVMLLLAVSNHKVARHQYRSKPLWPPGYSKALIGSLLDRSPLVADISADILSMQ